MIPKSETDTELFPLLVKHFMESEGQSLTEAITSSFSMVEGQNAFILMSEESDKLYIAKRASSLHVGLLPDGFIIGSEVAVFQNYT